MTTIHLERAADWRDRAVCLDTPNPDIFFPSPIDDEAHAAVIHDYCDVCPVRAACLADALTQSPTDQHGIRGGLSATARQLMARREGRQEKTVCRHGHPYTPENTLWTSKGHRRCATCMRRAGEMKNAKRRAGL